MFSASTIVLVVGLSMTAFGQLEEGDRIIAEVGTTVTIPAGLSLDEDERVASLVWKHGDDDIVTAVPAWNSTTYEAAYQLRALLSADNYDLMMSGLEFADSGEYTLSGVTSKGPSDATRYLEVLASPVVSTRPQPITDDGSGSEQIVAECIAKGGSDPFTIEWYDGETLLVNTTSSVDTANAEYDFLIDSVLQLRMEAYATRDNGRVFTCVVNDALGQRVEDQVSLDVTEPTTTVQTTTMQAFPTITKFPNSKAITLVMGKNRVLTCKATGVPEPTVTWYKDGTQLTTGFGESRIDVEANDYSKSGTYRCEARNGEGVVENELIVDVQGPPVIAGVDDLANETEQYVLNPEDEYATLMCQSDAYPKPVIFWTVDGANISALDTSYKAEDDDGRTFSYMNISSTHFTGSNSISKVFCTAANFHGNAKKTFVVTVPVASSNIGLIVGIVVALVLLVVIGIFISYFVVARKRKGSMTTTPESGMCGWSTCCGGSKVKSKELEEEEDIATVEQVKEVGEEGTQDEKQKLTAAEEEPAKEEKNDASKESGDEEKIDEEKPKKNKRKVLLPMQCCRGKKKENKTENEEEENEAEVGEDGPEKEAGNGKTKTGEHTESDSGKGDTLEKVIEEDAAEK